MPEVTVPKGKPLSLGKAQSGLVRALKKRGYTISSAGEANTPVLVSEDGIAVTVMRNAATVAGSDIEIELGKGAIDRLMAAIASEKAVSKL